MVSVGLGKRELSASFAPIADAPSSLLLPDYGRSFSSLPVAHAKDPHATLLATNMDIQCFPPLCSVNSWKRDKRREGREIT